MKDTHGDHAGTTTTPTTLTIGDRTFTSRLLLGTGGFRSLEAMAAAIEASGTELVTVALRRVDPDARGSIVDVLDDAGVAAAAQHRRLLHRARRGADRQARPRGVRDRLGQARGHRRRPDAAARRAGAARGRRGARRRRLRRAALHERRPDPRPPARGRRLRGGDAARLADRLGHGICNPYNLRLIRERAAVPVVLDAGVGTASDAALAMELGCDAVLCASAISRAEDPTGDGARRRAGRRGGQARVPRRARSRSASTPRPRPPRRDGPSSERGPQVQPVDVDGLFDAWERAFSGRDAAAFAPLCAPGFQYEDPLTREPLTWERPFWPRARALARLPRRARRTAPASGSPNERYAVAPAKLLGTHGGRSRACAATRRAVVVHGVFYAELRDGRLFRVRAFFDVYEAGVQLGVLPEDGQHRRAGAARAARLRAAHAVAPTRQDRRPGRERPHMMPFSSHPTEMPRRHPATLTSACSVHHVHRQRLVIRQRPGVEHLAAPRRRPRREHVVDPVRGDAHEARQLGLLAG